MAVDLAEELGVAPMIARSDPILPAAPFGEALHDLTETGRANEA